MTGYIDSLKKKYEAETAAPVTDKKEDLIRAKQSFKAAYQDYKLAEKEVIRAAKQLRSMTRGKTPEKVTMVLKQLKAM
jgi:hypothetical protein